MLAGWWDIAETFCEITLRLLFQVRVQGSDRVPRHGAVMFVSNHQSYLDPIVNGIATKDRQVGYLARHSLFRGPFGKLIASVGAIPLKEHSDMAAIRAAIQELKAGRCITVYPEGGRSEDGAVGAFQRGVALILRRTHVPVVPMAVRGTFAAWPSSRMVPRFFQKLSVTVGEPISAAVLLGDSDDGVSRLRNAVVTLHGTMGRHMDTSHG